MTRALPHISAMTPYALAETTLSKGVEPIPLSQNESLRPPSPLAIAAATESLERSELYPDPDWTDLRLALANVHNLAPESILCGNGSLDLIGCITRVFAGPNSAVLAPAHAYPFFRTASQMANARFDSAPERNATVDVDALLNAVRPDTGLLLLANPGNPTGTRISKAEIERLRAALPSNILLVIDEAYGEFEDDPTERCFDMVRMGNTVVLRTFWKAYGIAGLRVGWGVFSASVAVEVLKVMNPNNVSCAAQSGAVAALSDQDYMRETCEMTKGLRRQAADNLRNLSFSVYPSHTNFLLIDLQTEDAAISVEASLREKGVLVRRQMGAGLPSAVRITIGQARFMDAAVSALESWKKEFDA